MFDVIIYRMCSSALTCHALGAEEAASAALRLEPDNVKAKHRRGLARKELGMVAAALVALQQVLAAMSPGPGTRKLEEDIAKVQEAIRTEDQAKRKPDAVATSDVFAKEISPAHEGNQETNSTPFRRLTVEQAMSNLNLDSEIVKKMGKYKRGFVASPVKGLTTECGLSCKCRKRSGYENAELII